MGNNSYTNKGFKIVTGTDEVVYNFKAVIPLANAVISAITFDTNAGYAGDSAIVGKTLTAGVVYPIHGKSITLTSGSVFLEGF